MTKIWKSLRVTEQTHEHFKFITSRMGIDVYKFLEALGTQLMDVFSEFKPQGANCFYDVRGNQLIITVFGKSYLVSGSFPSSTNLEDSEADKLIQKRVGEGFKEAEEK